MTMIIRSLIFTLVVIVGGLDLFSTIGRIKTSAGAAVSGTSSGEDQRGAGSSVKRNVVKLVGTLALILLAAYIFIRMPEFVWNWLLLASLGLLTGFALLDRDILNHLIKDDADHADQA